MSIEEAYKERLSLLKQVIETSRDEIFLAARTLQEFSNPQSIIGMDIYERLRRTHELLRSTVEVLEGRDGEEPK